MCNSPSFGRCGSPRNERLLTVTGGLMIGPEDGTLVRGVLESAAEHAVPYEVLSSNEITSPPEGHMSGTWPKRELPNSA